MSVIGRYIGGLAATSLIALSSFGAGCADQVTDPSDFADEQFPEVGTATLGLRFDVIGDTETRCGEAAGVRVAIAKGDDRQECVSMWADAFISSPYTGVDDDGDHHVADCFFVVPPGIWTIEDVSAVGIDGEPLACCEAEWPSKMTVTEGSTTEFGAELSCDVVASGGLDIYGYLNRPPIITDVTISPSKFGPPCPPITLEASADDPEGDDVTFDWMVVTAPEGAVYNLDENGSTAVFTAQTVGDYEIRVTVTDGPHNTSTSLTFPIHIVGEPVGACDLVPLMAGVQTQMVDNVDPVGVGGTISFTTTFFNEQESNESLDTLGASFMFGGQATVPPMPGRFVPEGLTILHDTDPDIDPVTGAVNVNPSGAGVSMKVGLDYVVVASSTGLQVIQFDPGFELLPGEALYFLQQVRVAPGTPRGMYQSTALFTAFGTGSGHAYDALTAEPTTVDNIPVP